jgi:phosphoribosylanthranilate isomerase
MTHVKICGITDKVHALAAAEAGADFIGLVFAPSPRQVKPNDAGQIVHAISKSGCAVKTVGVFVNTPASQVNAIADLYHLDWVQLSGDETWDYCLEINRPIIKAVRPGTRSPDDICAELTLGAKVLSTRLFLALLDSKVEGKYGGTGIAFDWSLARLIATRFQVIVAGGLTPENVGATIQMVAPWGVDVSSGVEVEGVKDIARIRAFIEAARSADARRDTASGARQSLLPAEIDNP